MVDRRRDKATEGLRSHRRVDTRTMRRGLKMANFIAKVRTIVYCKFIAENMNEAEKIATQKVWDAFDHIDALHEEIELNEIEDIIDVDDDDEADFWNQ